MFVCTGLEFPSAAMVARSVDSDASKRIAGLFMLHGPAVFRRARRLLGNAADAEEATQEIFIRALQARFEERSQQTTWLYQITTNYCLNLLRDRARRAQLREQHFAPDAHAEGDAGDLVLVRWLLARADPKGSAAAACVFIEGASHEEAAELLGVSRRTVGNLLDRFRDWAREQTSESGAMPKLLEGES
jgi:RNA polymerase sigma-70 factor (ECF subfamily)